MAEDRAAAVFTDPPYNVPIDGHVSGLGTIHHREFAMASGEMTALRPCSKPRRFSPYKQLHALRTALIAHHETASNNRTLAQQAKAA